MSEEIKSLSDLDVSSSDDTSAVEIAAPRVAVRDDLGRSYACLLYTSDAADE